MTPDDALLQTQTTIRVAARQIMRRYTGHYVGWTLEDLEQEGALGALQACRTFEAARGIPFATFAARRIRGAMWDFIRRAVPGTRRWTVTLVALEEEP